MGLRQTLLDVVLADLPSMSSTLDASSPRWDELLGGKKAPGVWGRFSTGYGTTCIVVLDGWAISAGFPQDMVVTVDTPSGGGTKILQAMYAGATSRGWIQQPVRGALPPIRPGDVYVSNHTTSDGSDGTHVGVVTAVRPIDDQSMAVDTADGGQGTRDHQYAGRRTRTFKLSQGAHPVLIETPGVGESWLERWIAVGGDEPLDAPADEDSGGGPGGQGGGPGPGGSGGAAVLGLAGAVLVAGGLWWYFADRPGRANALRSAPMRDATVNLAPTGDVDLDYASRRRFEDLLARSGVEVTGAGMALGDGRSLGADVDVRCPGACDADVLDDLARRAGTSVLEINYWKES